MYLIRGLLGFRTQDRCPFIHSGSHSPSRLQSASVPLLLLLPGAPELTPSLSPLLPKCSFIVFISLIVLHSG